MKITIDDGGLQVRLQGISQALGNLTPFFGAVHDIFIDFEKEVFKSENSYSGDGWEPLSPSYAIWKHENYPGQGIMRLTDSLYKSLTQKGNVDHVYRTGPSWMEVGTRRLYARAQHFGYPPRNLPARPLIPKISKAEGERIVDAMLTHLLKAARGGRRT